MAVHFKFRSAVAYDSINLDDLFISVRNLKQRIVEHKNLASNRTIDFDLVITDSQTGEEYRDENHLVPRNTSVIIKRVPAAKTRSFMPSAVEQPKIVPKPYVPAPAPPRLPSVSKSEVEGDDFGVDLFAAPTPALAPAPPVRSDEDAKIMEMVSKSTLEWQRFDNSYAQPRGGKGRGRGSGGPPAGYVCHRCGQPGHFIQQCPTNGDPNYDIKKVRLPVGIPRTRLRIDQEGSYVLPDGSVAAMQPDENLFAKETDALMAVKQTTEVPPELRCPLCRVTFKEAVMIPCCHYSFCDKCIRQNLMMKGQCPQCGSLRFKNDDLLPNIALRQAIDKFLESQVTTSAADQSFVVPDGDSASHQVIAPTESRNSADDNADAGKHRDTSSGVVIAENSVASKTDANLHPVIPKDASGSVNLEGNEPPLRENGDGGNASEPFVLKGADDIALESEVSKGKKKKKRARAGNAGDSGGADASTAVKQGERYCFQCGSPGHLAKDCVENVGSYPPHPGMFPPGGPFPMAPYGPDMFWHGPPVPFGPGYGDGMYGPGLGGPMAAAGAYQMPPCMPPPYGGVPPMWFGDHPGMMSGEMPVSRKEFMKLQEEEHNRRAMNDYRGDWSHGKGRSSDTRDRNGAVDRHGHKSDADYRSYSDKYRDDKYPSDKYSSDKYPSDKYDKYSGDKYSSEKYSSDKYKPRALEDSSRRKSDRDSLERERGDSHRREKDVSRSSDGQHKEKEKQRSSSAAEQERRYSEAPAKEERRSKFSSRPSDGGDERAEKRADGSKSRGYDREGEQESDDGGRRKKRREKSREEEYSASKYSSSDGHSSRKHSSEAAAAAASAAAADDHHARWRPDEDRYWDDRKHSSSSSSRHHHRR